MKGNPAELWTPEQKAKATNLRALLAKWQITRDPQVSAEIRKLESELFAGDLS
jgi:hypothetical protein